MRCTVNKTSHKRVFVVDYTDSKLALSMPIVRFNFPKVVQCFWIK